MKLIYILAFLFIGNNIFAQNILVNLQFNFSDKYIQMLDENEVRKKLVEVHFPNIVIKAQKKENRKLNFYLKNFDAEVPKIDFMIDLIIYDTLMNGKVSIMDKYRVYEYNLQKEFLLEPEPASGVSLDNEDFTPFLLYIIEYSLFSKTSTIPNYTTQNKNINSKEAKSKKAFRNVVTYINGDKNDKNIDIIEKQLNVKCAYDQYEYSTIKKNNNYFNYYIVRDKKKILKDKKSFMWSWK